MHLQRERIIAGNWKMNGDLESNWKLLDAIAAHRDKQEETIPDDQDSMEVLSTCILFPPAPYIGQVANVLEKSIVLWGAQNISQYSHGAYTGEISATMLKDFNCTHTLVGHSERRSLFGETDSVVAEKFQVARNADLIPVLCVGETLSEREAGKAEEVLEKQLSVISNWENSVIAYEPVWAIGTGVTATPEQAQAMHVWIRQYIAKKSPAIAEKISILYGGSVKASNAKDLFAMPDIDGALVGGASLVAEDFIAILNAAEF